MKSFPFNRRWQHADLCGDESFIWKFRSPSIELNICIWL